MDFALRQLLLGTCATGSPPLSCEAHNIATVFARIDRIGIGIVLVMRVLRKENMRSHPTVLVVDDDENILSAFGRFLQKEHCTMISALDAQEGMKKLGEQRVDLIITDVRLKSRSGVTFLIEAKIDRPKIPIIVITGYHDVITEKEAKEYGADYFFLKPLEVGKLRDAVRKCLHLRESS